MNEHRSRVEEIAASVRQFHERGQRWRVYHAGSNSTRKPHRSDAVIDTSALSNVLRVDAQSFRAIVEPNVCMESLVRETLLYGVLPAVVMEFPAITVGGGFSGNSGESSSWRHGLFDSTITSIEIVLGNGDIVTANESENTDLLYAAAGGHGVLGLVTLLEVQLIKALPFVEIACIPIQGIPQAIETMQALFKDDKHTYIDGVMFGVDKGIVMAGRLTAEMPNDIPVRRFTRAVDQWFFREVEKLASKQRGMYSIACPITDYLFRWDRGAFWGGKFAFRYFLTPFNRATRFMLDPFLDAKTMFRALHHSGLAGETLIQDIGVPICALEDFTTFLDKKLRFEYYWLCPIARRHKNNTLTFSPRSGEDTTRMWVNVGIWGPGPKSETEFIEVNRAVERKTHELGGLKALYARTYYTEDEFWTIYNKEEHDRVRSKYSATFLPTLFDKVGGKFVVDDLSNSSTPRRRTLSRRPLPGIKGVLGILLGRDHLRKP